MGIDLTWTGLTTDQRKWAAQYHDWIVRHSTDEERMAMINNQVEEAETHLSNDHIIIPPPPPPPPDDDF